MRQATAAGPVGSTGWAVRGALVALGVVASVYVVSTIPGVRSTSGFNPRVDGWIQGSAFVLTAVVAALRPAVSAVDRLLWSLVALALALRAFAYLYYFAEIRTQVPQPYPSISDACWLASSLVLIAALVVLIHPRAGRFSLLLILDALIVALTVGSVAVALLWETMAARLVPGASTSVITVNMAYPLLDVALLVLCGAFLTLVRWRPTAGVVSLIAGIVGFAVIDAVFLYQITAGTFRPATFLSALNMVATLAIAYAGWINHWTGDLPVPLTDDKIGVARGGGIWIGPRGVLLPVVCAVICFAVEGWAEAQGQPQSSALLPLAGVVAVIVRGVTTLFTERSAAEQELRSKNDELLRFQSLVEASGDFIAIAGIDGSVIYLNPAGRDLVGIATDLDVTTTTITDYLTEEGIKASLEIEQPAILAHGHWEGESTLRNHRGGRPIPVAISSFVMLHPVTREPMALATVQRDITERLIAQTTLQELADQRQELLDRLVQAQEDERARIASDVHDDSVQALAAVELRLGLLRRRLTERAPDLVASIDQMVETVDLATSRLRHLLFDLDSPALRDDLADALDQAAAYVFEDDLGWTVTGDRSIDLPEGLRVTAYRIAKEAMVNVRKHAEATKATIEVCRVGGGVEVRITDDGRGLGPDDIRDQPGHLGVTGMRDRAAVAGGWLRVDSPPDGGTVVRLWLPDPALEPPETTSG
jgi:PAS domain S-box-containing protein